MDDSKLTPSQRYYQTHKEQRKQYGRDYYHKNRDKILKGLKDTKAVNTTESPTPSEKRIASYNIDASGCFLVVFE